MSEDEDLSLSDNNSIIDFSSQNVHKNQFNVKMVEDKNNDNPKKDSFFSKI